MTFKMQEVANFWIFFQYYKLFDHAQAQEEGGTIYEGVFPWIVW